MALARSVVSAGAMLAVYSLLLPLDNASGSTLAMFGLGLAVLVAMLYHQLRSVVASPYPLLRAVEALATTLPFFVLLFAAVFVVMSHRDASAFTEVLDRTAALYFALTVFTTVGFGDIAPTSDAARLAVVVQMVGNVVVVGLVARVLVGAARTRPS